MREPRRVYNWRTILVGVESIGFGMSLNGGVGEGKMRARLVTQAGERKAQSVGLSASERSGRESLSVS